MDIVERSYSDGIKARDILSDRDVDELSHAQQIGLEYLRKNMKIADRDSFEELYDELSEVESIKEKHVIKLLELLPTEPEEVETIFSKERVKLEDSDIDRIVEICSSYTDA
ncbi:MAG: hypothetical protein MUP66_01785 [Candidatus Nanohaloarchaeota archaeon QJJ-5]|nr:hypothetical protein [Candidatus Nanohaloarchaeota archaeon QJJ-5]